MSLSPTFSTLADAELLAHQSQHPADLQLHNFIERERVGLSFARWMRVNCEIDERDEIFQFFANHPTSLNPPRDYLADGWRTLSELVLLLDRLKRPLQEHAAVLEFASGYGRFTRHLSAQLPQRLWVSDVMPGALEFAQSRFGVQGFAAHLDPRQIVWPRTFDLVFVLSLLTHVPPAQWTPWLRALYAATAPGGALIFSVHSEHCDKPPGATLGANGTLFFGASESTYLDPTQYGTTYTSRAFVQQACLDALGVAPSAHTETCFWIGQDAVVIEKK